MYRSSTKSIELHGGVYHIRKRDIIDIPRYMDEDITHER
jgi:hypothetical protein